MHRLDQFTLPTGFRGRSAWFVQLWWLVDAALFRTSPQILYSWRNLLLRIFGAKIGKNVRIRASVRVTFPWRLKIGDFSWIGDDVTLYSLAPIELGSHAVVSQKCYLCAGSHDYKSPRFSIFSKSVLIESHVWLGTDVFIGPGVRIAEGVVIGARSSVFTDIVDMGVYVGSPAKFNKERIMTDD